MGEGHASWKQPTLGCHKHASTSPGKLLMKTIVLLPIHVCIWRYGFWRYIPPVIVSIQWHLYDFCSSTVLSKMLLIPATQFLGAACVDDWLHSQTFKGQWTIRGPYLIQSKPIHPSLQALPHTVYACIQTCHKPIKPSNPVYIHTLISFRPPTTRQYNSSTCMFVPSNRHPIIRTVQLDWTDIQHISSMKLNQEPWSARPCINAYISITQLPLKDWLYTMTWWTWTHILCLCYLATIYKYIRMFGTHDNQAKLVEKTPPAKPTACSLFKPTYTHTRTHTHTHTHTNTCATIDNTLKTNIIYLVLGFQSHQSCRW